QAIESEGASVTVIDGSYDDAVERAKSGAGPRSLVVSDTSWEGYTAIPALVAEGYETIFAEADAQLAALHEPGPTHVFVQIGVGALAVAAVNHYRGLATVIGIEPDGADCVLQSAAAGRIVSVPGPHISIMAGLNCGTPSAIAWPIMRNGITAFVSVDDERAIEAMRGLAGEGVVSGETGASGLAGLLELMADAAEAANLGLGPDARVLLLSTEGATDPAFYERVTGRRP
ncbi:MAG: pyridoxal-phosphate dependent enzyme, partial [bacterium]